MADQTTRRCGNRDPDCPRPEYCDDCLPRDRKRLDERILVRCDPSWYGLRDNPPKVFAALRAVVELHAPIPCGWPTCKTPDTHRLCAACGSAVNHPCPELELIADQLGLTEGERHD